MRMLRLSLLAISLFGLGTGRGTAEPAPPESAANLRTVSVDGQELPLLGFDLLSAFPYEIVDEATGATEEEIAAAMARDQVPSWVHAFDGKQVVLKGYLMPLKIVDGKATKFVMMKDVTTCCYGATPNMNDYVVCSARGDGLEVIQDVPVGLVGTFRVEQRYEGGYVVSLYVMTGERLIKKI